MTRNQRRWIKFLLVCNLLFIIGYAVGYMLSPKREYETDVPVPPNLHNGWVEPSTDTHVIDCGRIPGSQGLEGNYPPDEYRYIEEEDVLKDTSSVQ